MEKHTEIARFQIGSTLANSVGMGFKTLDEIVAFQVAHELKLEIYRLVKTHQAAARDFEFRDQIFDSASGIEMNIAEGFRRNSIPEFARFLRIANSCAEETTRWTQDGIDRGYYAAPDAQEAFRLADRANRLISGLIASFEPLIKRRRSRRTERRER